MKVLIVSHEFPPIGGGGANACYYLSREFVKKGIDVTIVTANYQGLPVKEKVNGAKVYRVNSKRKHKDHCSFGEMADFILKAYPLLKKLARQEKYDLCQIFFGIPSGPLGYLLKKKYHIPYVIRFGGGDIPGFQERFKIVYKFIGPFLKVIWKNADALVANSEGLQKMAYDFYKKKSVNIIPNGVDSEFFCPGEKEKADRFDILFVSRLIERKGLQYVLPQLKDIQNGTEKTVHLTVVGDGPFKSNLEQMAVDLNIQDMVSFEGGKTKEELIPYYQKADVFILPSEKEGMPNVVLEAMASGLPIIMTPCEGSKELVQGNGKICNVDNFKNEIEKMLSNKELLIKYGRESRKMALEQFSWNIISDRYMKLYLKLERNDEL